MLDHFHRCVKSCSVTPHYRILAVGIALTLLPLIGVQAKSPKNPARWAQCEPDELAREIVPATPNAPPPDEAPIQVDARQVESSSTQSQLEGNVSLTRGEQRLRAEHMTLERPANRAVVDTPFVYGDHQQALRGKRATVDLDAGTGQFEGVDYYLPGRNAQGSAAKVAVDRDKKQSRLKNAMYSTCARGKEAWEIRTRKLKLNDATGRGEARDVVLAFWDTPVFYFPYLSFPITDKRQSGFLAPIQGYTSTTGLDLAFPYYWNIAPERDMTLTPRWVAERGLLLGMEYRFLGPSDQGQVHLEYMPDDRRYGGERGSFNIIDRAAPLPNTYTDLRFEYVSDDRYLWDLGNHLTFLTTNYLERHFDALYQGEGWQALARVQGFQILNPALFALSGKPYQRLPQLLFDSEPLSGAGGLHYQLHSELVNFQQSDVVTGTRLDLWPSAYWLLQQPWGYLKPQGSFRYTGYQLDNTAADANDAPSRAAPIASLDSGLIFERPLHADWLGVASGTQTLEPRLFYLYVPYRNQNDIPVFDSSLMDHDYDWLFRQNRFTGGDRLGDANQVTIALTTRAIDGASGRERLRASIGQIQYFEDRRVTLSTTDVPETAATSGLIAQGQMNFSTHWSMQGGVQFEPDSSDLLRTGIDLRYYANAGQLLNLSYLMDRDQPDLDLHDQIESADVSLAWPLSSRWRILGRWNQALNLDRNLETLAGLEYEDCCWAIRTVARQYRDSPAQIDSQTAFYLELELKGLSQWGSSLETQLRNSILGYQPLR